MVVKRVVRSENKTTAYVGLHNKLMSKQNIPSMCKSVVMILMA